MNEPQAYLNGRMVGASDATVGVTDAGFVLGATVAEQVRTFAGKLFRLDDHLARLADSLHVLGLDAEVDAHGLAGPARELAERNHRLMHPGDDLGLSIVVTPGPYPTFAPAGQPLRPTVCMHTYALPFGLWADKYGSGQALVTSQVQQVSPDCWPPGLKCRSRMHYYLADRRAGQIEPGARAMLLDSDGLVTETSTANILVYRDCEGLLSPPGAKILPGISLRTTIELADQIGVGTVERDLTPAEVASADEVFLTGTSASLLPVVRLDGRPIAHGRPGRLFARLLDAWSGLTRVDIAVQAGRFALAGSRFDKGPNVT